MKRETYLKGLDCPPNRQLLRGFVTAIHIPEEAAKGVIKAGGFVVGGVLPQGQLPKAAPNLTELI